MDNPEDGVFAPDFQEEPQNEQEIMNFIAAMITAKDENQPVQVFRRILEEAPVVPVETLYRLTNGFLSEGHLSVVTQMLLEHEPEIARYVDRLGDTLLHSAIASTDPVQTGIVRVILDANPNATHVVNSNGFLPLHLAVEHGASVAVEHGASVETFELLLSQDPGAASVSALEWVGDLPLHMAMHYGSDEPIILVLLDAFSGAASVEGIDGVALHLACAMMYSIKITKRLVEIYPDGVFSQDIDGNLPLHIACQRRPSSLEVVKFLLERHPDSIKSRGEYGQLPLHYAANVRANSLELIQYLIELYPEAVNTTDDSGNLPLHKACGATVASDVIQLFLDRYADDGGNQCGSSIVNNDGQLPLHCYCSRHHQEPDTGALQHLLDLYPHGIHVADRNGMLPLHVACSNALPSLDTIRLLVEADPFTVVRSSRNGSTPYQLAWRLSEERKHVNVEAYLIEKQNEAVAALKAAYVSVAETQLGLPDLVVAAIWSFAKPDIWIAPA